MGLDCIGERHHLGELANVTLWVLDAFVECKFLLIRKIEGDALDDIFAFVATLLAELPYLGWTHLGGDGYGERYTFDKEFGIEGLLKELADVVGFAESGVLLDGYLADAFL